MSNLKCLVLAQGNGKRWDDKNGKPYNGIPKHLLEINGERLIDRVCNQFANDTDLLLVCPKDKRYPLKYNHKTFVDPFPTKSNVDKLFASSPYWNREGSTLIVFGDVYYTDDAVKKILDVSKTGKNLHYFRRPWKSKITGHSWDETFAMLIPKEEQFIALQVAFKTLELERARVIPASYLRLHYLVYLNWGKDLRKLYKEYEADKKILYRTPHQTIIDDFTDDFDKPQEFEEWIKRFKCRKK